MVILQSSTITTVLPNPQLANTKGNKVRFTPRVSMNGTRRNHVHKSATEYRGMQFVLTRDKARELETFLIRNYASGFLVIWNSERFYGFLKSNPVEFTEESRGKACYGGSRYVVTLEFEGSVQ